jgi:hypothetical protein
MTRVLEQITSSVARARCAAIPALQEFAEAIAPFTALDAEAFWHCELAFSRLVATSFLTDSVTWELERLRSDPDHTPPGASEFDFEILIMNSTALTAHVHVPDRSESSGLLYGPCDHTLVINQGPGVLCVEQWEQPNPGPADIINRDHVLEPRATVQLQPGHLYRARAHRDVHRLSARDRPALAVALTRGQVTALRWGYDEATLRPVQIQGARSGPARLEYAFTLLAAMAHVEAAPVIASLIEHPDHYVRWSAVRRVMALDPSLGMHLVQRSRADPHPHVRRAAERALSRLASASTLAAKEN